MASKKDVITFGELKELINAVPQDRDDDLVSVFDLKHGVRFHIMHLDLDIDGTVDVNIDTEEYNK